jgi:hypothetical protein
MGALSSLKEGEGEGGTVECRHDDIVARPSGNESLKFSFAYLLPQVMKRDALIAGRQAGRHGGVPALTCLSGGGAQPE